jgi:hypothetical protein
LGLKIVALLAADLYQRLSAGDDANPLTKYTEHMTVGRRLQRHTEKAQDKHSRPRRRTSIKLSDYQRPVNPRPCILMGANVMSLNVHAKPKMVNIAIFYYLLSFKIFINVAKKKPAVGFRQNCGSHIYQAQQGSQAKRLSRTG